MTEADLLQDCLKRLNASGISYFLTGSMASNYWGVPRTTHDIDLVVQLRDAEVSLLVQAFAGDFFIQEPVVRAGLRPPHQFNALDTRSALKVDFWVLTAEPFAQEMFARRRSVSLFGVPSWIASAEDVLLHKLYWCRLTPSERQMSDATGIWAVQGKQLDLDHIRKWASDLNVVDLFEQIETGLIKPKST